MNPQHARPFSRRRFLGGVMLAGTAGLLCPYSRVAAAEPPPEVTRLRLIAQPGSICVAPKYVAEALLQAEGFIDIHYTEEPQYSARMQRLAAGETDLDFTFVGPLITRIDAGDPIVVLAGGHIGCFELFGSGQVRTIRDLKGKTVAIPDRGLGGSPQYIFLSSMLAYVGLDPGQDIQWVTQPRAASMRLLAEGKIDAYLGFPPDPQELRAKQIGHVIVNSTVDRPWSQYFCCMVASNRDFVRRHPVATKRALRAVLKATDVCALEPERVAQSMVDKGFTQSYTYALQTLQEVPYNRWREYNPEDTVRFYALRLHEAGMIKSSPQKLIAEGTDWHFFNELKQELKG
jgi:NitT/TauT family transport system substrate-binding protein